MHGQWAYTFTFNRALDRHGFNEGFVLIRGVRAMRMRG